MLSTRLVVPGAGDGGEGHDNLFTRVKAEVDVWKLLPRPASSKDFGHYYLRSCIHPDHEDTQHSLLVFHDGVRCQSCGFHGDAVDIYRLWHPESGVRQAAEALLAGDFKMEGEAAAPREAKHLDQDLATRYHLELAGSAEGIAGLHAMGFTSEAIRHFRLGLARVLVRLDDDEVVEGLEGLEWRERDGVKTPYQWQWRFAVPIFSEDGRLRQFIYRKANVEDGGPKVTMEYGAGTQWLFNEAALKGAKTAVFSSGWGDVIVQWQWGIPAVSGIAGDGHFRPEWADKLGHVRRLYSVTDADKAGLKLRERLNGFLPWIRHISLPYEIGSKKDVRDFLLEGNPSSAYLQLMKKADQERIWRAVQRKV